MQESRDQLQVRHSMLTEQLNSIASKIKHTFDPDLCNRYKKHCEKMHDWIEWVEIRIEQDIILNEEKRAQ